MKRMPETGHRIKSISMRGLFPQEAFGDKTHQYRRLFQFVSEAQAGGLSLAQPFAYGIPALRQWREEPGPHNLNSVEHVGDVFARLIYHENRDVVLMARSSFVGESQQTGKWPSHFIYVEKDNPAPSIKRFVAAVNDLREMDPDRMGVLAMPMVGEVTTLPDGRRVVGANNVSLVADSHNAYRPDEMHFALVHGLGTKAVGDAKDVISIHVDRATGRITQFLNMTDAATMAETASILGVSERRKYRQQTMDVFSIEEGRVVTVDLPGSIFGKLKQGHGILEGVIGTVPPSHLLTNNRGPYLTRVPGAVPLGELGAYHTLFGGLQFLSRQVGPVQIEGAFADPMATQLSLYQLLPIPELEASSRPLQLQNPQLRSSLVFGRGRHQIPLVVAPVQDSADFRAIDRRFSETGYMLLVDIHERPTIEQTPHCVVRLATSVANPSAHAPTAARQIIAADPARGFIFASGVIDYDEISTRLPKPDQKWNGAWVYRNAEVESNGMEVAVRVEKRKLAGSLQASQRAVKSVGANSLGRIGGGVLGAAFCGYDIYDFFANSAFNREVSNGIKITHGTSATLSTSSFVAGALEMIKKVPLGKVSFGLGSAAGMIYSALDVYKSYERWKNDEIDNRELNFSVIGASLTTLPTAVFGAGLFGVTATPLWMAAAGLATVGAMGLGLYRAVAV